MKVSLIKESSKKWYKFLKVVFNITNSPLRLIVKLIMELHKFLKKFFNKRSPTH